MVAKYPQYPPTDLELTKMIIERLESDVKDYGVAKAPPRLDQYFCTHAEGEILVKTARRVNTYFTRNMGKVTYDFQYLSTRTIRLTLVETSVKTFDNLYLMSEQVEAAMGKIYPHGASRIYLLNAEEPAIEYEKSFVYRDLIFTTIIHQALEG